MLNIARDKFLKSLERLEEGSLTLALPDGKNYSFAGCNSGPAATMRIDDWSVVSHVAQSGDTALALDYAEGKWHTDNIQNLVTLALLNEAAVKKYIFGNPIINILYNLFYKLRANTMRGSRRNIQAHYDLGNDFYELWLDRTMTYSSALYKAPDENLLSAQINKYDRIIDRLNSQSGEILEIGCGWGGCADRALQRGDFAIKGITLSDTQYKYARIRLKGRVDIVLEDYRLQDRKYDHIISIEMFEAVGEKYWSTYFQKIAALLKSGGKALIQTITIDEKLFESYRTGQDFVRSLIFPGGMLPSSARFEREAAKAGLRVNNRFDFGPDYVRTLQQWFSNFETQKASIHSLGYDQKFMRLWSFYLAACASGFQTGRTDVSQFELQHV